MRRCCSDCGHRRRERHLRPGGRLRKRLVFARYLSDLAQGSTDSLRTMQWRYDIAMRTALRWRQRALDVALAMVDDQPVLSGEIEVDEMSFPRGEPGRRSPEARALRPSRNRGSGRQVGRSGKDTVALVAAIQRVGCPGGPSVIRSAPNATSLSLGGALSGQVAQGTVIITDGWRAYRAVAEEMELVPVPLLGGTPVGSYHLNTVNSLHSRLRGFLSNFNGLHHRQVPRYLAWFQLLQTVEIQARIYRMARRLGHATCALCGR
jgi:hypothetical protein